MKNGPKHDFWIFAQSSNDWRILWCKRCGTLVHEEFSGEKRRRVFCPGGPLQIPDIPPCVEKPQFKQDDGPEYSSMVGPLFKNHQWYWDRKFHAYCANGCGAELKFEEETMTTSWSSDKGKSWRPTEGLPFCPESIQFPKYDRSDP